MIYKKVILLNGTFSGSQHEMIDSSLIIAFALIAEKVFVYFQPRRKEIIKSLVEQRTDNQNITYNNIFNLSDTIRVTFRELIAAIQECWIFLTKADKNTLTCLTYINRFNCYGLNSLSKITGRPLIIVCHGELKHINTTPHQGEINWVKMLRHFYKDVIIAPHTILMVLGSNIKGKIDKLVSEEKAKKYISWEHPYYRTSSTTIQALHHPIRIGVIGFLKREKERGFDNVKKLAFALSNDCEFELRLLSSIQEDLLQELPKTVRIMNPESRFIPRSEYNQMIEELDYIYCPYPTGAFEMTASGALLEAMAQRRPIIMHNNDYTIHLIKLYGNFGIIIDDEDEGFERLKQTLKNETQYSKHIAQQDRILEMISPESLSQNLEKICNCL